MLVDTEEVGELLSGHARGQEAALDDVGALDRLAAPLGALAARALTSFGRPGNDRRLMARRRTNWPHRHRRRWPSGGGGGARTGNSLRFKDANARLGDAALAQPPDSGHWSGPLCPSAAPSQIATGTCTAKAIMNQSPSESGWRV